MKVGTTKAETVDQYLSALSSDKRDALERLRTIIRTAVPEAEECISYGMPAFRLDGKPFVWLGAAAHHCAIYGISGADDERLEEYDTTGKGTIRFPPDKPLPATLVRKLIKARLAADRARKQRPAGRARPKPSPS